jgi:pyocin large subunit-like protein
LRQEAASVLVQTGQGAAVGTALSGLSYGGLKIFSAFRSAKSGHKTADTWGQPKTLADHFTRHGGDFGAKTADEYVDMASDFLKRSQVERLPIKIAADGTIRVFDPKSGAFGSYNASGTTKTFYKPAPSQHKLPSNLDYWNNQPGVSPWEP